MLAPVKEIAMRHILAFLLGCSLALPAFAADETVFSEDDVWNLFTRVDVSYSEVGEDDGAFGGLRIGGILNDKLAIGLGVHTLLSEVDVAPNGYHNPDDFDIVYGGLALEYRFFANKLVHASLGALIGGGQISLNSKGGIPDEDIEFFALEPQLSVILNITESTEFGAAAAYRFADVSDNDYDNLSSSDLSAPVVSIFLRFTQF
jgi:hypothetical protein